MLSEDDASVALRVGGLLVTTIDTLSAEPSVSSSTVDVVPGDLSTTASVAVGGYVSGAIDTGGDHDWYRVNLVAGQTYTFSTILPGSGLPDSLLTLRDPAGNLISENDDAASSPNHYTFSELTFTATLTGTYFLDVSGFDPATDTGAFYLTVSAPVADAVAGSSATTASLAIGSAAGGTFEANGDHDWYAVTLTAGQSYLFATSATGGGSDPDTTLALRNASGSLISFNDNANGSYSQVRFTPTSSGTYYLDVAAWGNAASGAYKLSADPAPALPIFTNDEIAYQLTNTYWGGTARHWNVAPGGTITVNLTALIPEGQNLAREALNLWTDATGIIFNNVATGGQMVFDDNQTGAFTSSTRVGAFITSASINISTQWLTDYGTTLRSYAFQSYVHEIGHALGLGHGGQYNGTATYPADASYQNDSWATTVMSYFDQQENTYFSAQGFTRQYAVTPMIADLIAVQNLYGVNTTTRTGDTVYGVNSNAGRDAFNFIVGGRSVSYVIVDNGGIDTMDYSTSSSNQRIDLNPEAFSNIGGGVGNVSIARGTVIERAVGGSGSDTIIGNSADNTLIGNGGTDTISGGGGNDSLEGDAGNDTLDGGTGTNDEAVYLGNRAEYLVEYVTLNGVASVRVTGQGARVGDGVDVLTNIEFLKFADQRIAANGTPVNQLPVLNQALPDRLAGDGAPFSYQIPTGTFTDPDGNALTYTATLADGSALPGWLAFSAATQTFSGTPPLSAVGTLQIKVVASDNAPGDPSSFASDIFALQVYQSEGPSVIGTAGNDLLTGTFRVERLYGLGGDDTFIATPGPDFYDGGSGFDTVDYSGNSAGITVDMGAYADTGVSVLFYFTSIEALRGTGFNDTLKGDVLANTLIGGGGDDVLIGGLGNDTLDGGAGANDEARYAGNRSDYLVENVLINGVATVQVTGLDARAGDGIDLLSGIEFLQFSDQRIAAPQPLNQHPVLAQALPDQAAGDSALYTYQVPVGAFTDPDGNTLSYSATLSNGSPLPAWLSFDAANRTFTGTPPLAAVPMVLQIKVTATDNAPGDPASLASDIFALSIFQSPGADVVGTAQTDTLNGTFRAERMFGLDSDDVLNGSGGADQLDGGNGSDTVNYAASGAVSVNLATGLGSGGNAAADSYVSIENVIGSALGDVLTGNAVANVLTGNGGVDTLSGGAGDDRLVVNSEGSGSFVDGGADFDTLAISSFVSLGSIAGIEAIELISGANLTLTTSQLMAGLAPNTQLSGSGTITVNLEANVFTAMTSFQGASTINFVLNGSSGDDYIKAGHFNNTINGGVGRDFIRGGNGIDIIDGGADNDKITGWGGADILTGGSGSDQFRYFYATDSGLGAASDRITDFTIGSDLIDLRLLDKDLVTPDIQNYALGFIGNAAFGAGGAGQIRYGTSGSDMLVQFDLDGNGTSDMEIVLQGLAGQTLSVNDFLFGTAQAASSKLLASVTASESAILPDSALLTSDPLIAAPLGLSPMAPDAGLALLDPLGLLEAQHAFGSLQHADLLHLV